MNVKLTLEIEQGLEGLFYATSPDLKGLFVAAPTLDEVLTEIQRIIPVLRDRTRSGRTAP